jgi:hypothetical protein
MEVRIIGEQRLIYVSPKLNKAVMIMSSRAYNNFTKEQLEVITRNDIVIGHAGIPTIEQFGGGSVSSCIAELF